MAAAATAVNDDYFGETPVTLDTDFSNVVVVDNIPVVPMDKYEKLYGVFNKLFSRIGSIVQEGLYIPVGGDPQQTLGYAFIEYENQDDAAKAVRELDNYKLDKMHTLRVNMFRDFERYGSVPDVFDVKEEDFEAKAKNTSGWMLDEKGRDQYVVRHSTETEVWWNDPLYRKNQNGQELCSAGEAHKERGKSWTELYVAWSPKGSYLATFHQQGIALWGGDDFAEFGRFKHLGVRLLDFSPNENYVVTCNPMQPENPECIIIWDVRTGKKLRWFDGGEHAVWPAFRWSHDDKYVARIGKDKKGGTDIISIYEVPEMTLLEKKSIKVPGVKEIQWSPSENILSYWVPQQGDQPASVSLIEVPSRNVVATKHLYNVTDVRMFWQSKGDYLCVKIGRQKTKKTMSTNFEIFCLRVKNIPVESMEIEDNVMAFAWEPEGHRFAFIHERDTKTLVSFYSLRKNKKLELLQTLTDRPCNSLFWSPAGGVIILAGLGQLNGVLEWYDVDALEFLGTREHYKCNEVEWDPTGRFVITSVTQPLAAGGWKFASENGYKVWSFDTKGDGVWKATTEVSLDACYLVKWRPRPAPVLSVDERRNLYAKLKDTKYWKQFERIDDEERAAAAGEAERKQLAFKNEWKAYRNEKQREFQQDADIRRELRGGEESDDEDDYIVTEEEVEEVLDEKYEIVADPKAAAADH